jgi:hypothetical protein
VRVAVEVFNKDRQTPRRNRSITVLADLELN